MPKKKGVQLSKNVEFGAVQKLEAQAKKAQKITPANYPSRAIGAHRTVDNGHSKTERKRCAKRAPDKGCTRRSNTLRAFENPLSKKTRNYGARGGGAGPTPRPQAPPAGPAPNAHPNLAFLFVRQRKILQKAADSQSTNT